MSNYPMEEKIKHQLAIDKVKNFKKPTILMNSKDFEYFVKHLEGEVPNLKPGKKPTYMGIPVKSSDLIERDNLVIYDANEILGTVDVYAKAKSNMLGDIEYETLFGKK